MAVTSSHRPTREWPLLVLALALVLSICIPLWQWTAGTSLKDTSETWTKFLTQERLVRLLLGPEQIACYFCATWAGFILLSRYLEVRRQRRAFNLELLPTDPTYRIPPGDAQDRQFEVERKASRGGPYILANMVRLALIKYGVSRSGRDVAETIRTQADVELGRMVSSMAMVHYLAWAIPAIGFLGTVRGLAMSLTLGKAEESHQGMVQFMKEATQHLNVAFDCTLIALALSLVVMLLLHTVQRDEEALVLDSQEYCLEHLVTHLDEHETLA